MKSKQKTTDDMDSVKTKNPIKKLVKRKDSSIDSSKLPYITNETVAEHREEVLSGARKYIYPLQHSRHKIVWLSVAVTLVALITFITFSLLSLYRFQSTSTLTYRITQAVPFPIARANGRFVSYESYLFELRRNVHYYENQQKINFASDEGATLKEELKKQALEQAVNDAYVKSLAEENNVSVSTAELEKEIDLMIKQDRLGNDSRMLEDVLRDYWGWNMNDFKRLFRQQMLARKVASKVDTDAHDKAKSALEELKSGKEFSEVVNKYSDDELSKDQGGDYGSEITMASRDIPARVTDVIFSQKPDSVSEIIEADSTLEIVKTISINDGKAKAAHIQINLKPIDERISELRKTSPPRLFVGI